MLFRLCVILMAVLCAAGCGGKKKGLFSEEQMQSIPLANRYDLPTASGGMTMSLYGETITADEVLGALEARLRPAAPQLDRRSFVSQAMPLFREVVRSKVADILLYEEARKKAPANIDDALDKAVDQEVRKFIAGYSNNYALAERQIRKMGMDWRSFRDYQRKLILTQSYLSQKLDDKPRFTHSAMTAYYDQVRDEQFCETGKIEFHTIDIIPDRLSEEHIPDGLTRRDAAMQLGRALVERAQGGEDFAELGQQYSHGPMARAGGRWLPITIGADALSPPYDKLEAIAVAMEPGEVSGPIVSGNQVFVVKLKDKTMGGCKSFNEVQPQIEQQLLFKHRQQQYETFVRELTQQADFVEMERFAEFCAVTAHKRWSSEQ